MSDRSDTAGWRFGKVSCFRHYLFVAIGPKESHLEFLLYWPTFSWGWYGGPDWYHRWVWRRIERKRADAK